MKTLFIRSLILSGFMVFQAMAVAGPPSEAVAPTLFGKVAYKTFLGPPGFGETPDKDARVTVPILILTGLQTSSSEDPKATVIGENLQLLTYNSGDVKKFSGRCVEIQGEIHKAVAPGEFTDRTIIVNNIVESDLCK